MSIRDAAREMRINLRDTIIIAERVIGADADGEIYQWISGAWGGRWVRLVLVDAGPKELARVMRIKRASQR